MCINRVHGRQGAITPSLSGTRWQTIAPAVSSTIQSEDKTQTNKVTSTNPKYFKLPCFLRPGGRKSRCTIYREFLQRQKTWRLAVEKEGFSKPRSIGSAYRETCISNIIIYTLSSSSFNFSFLIIAQSHNIPCYIPKTGYTKHKSHMLINCPLSYTIQFPSRDSTGPEKVF